MRPSQTYDFSGGEVLLIDKPSGWTSFDVVNKIRYMIRFEVGIKKIKVGHAGTLDPLATGLLLVCVGNATKRIHEFTGLDKEYTGTFFIGATTPSFDLETETDQYFDTDHITKEMICKATEAFTGPIQQVPPAYSAIKIDGTRSYRHARKNRDVNIPARDVIIHEFEILSAGIPETSFRVLCSKGTYIRSLANDFGKYLSSGAYLQSLRRTSIGPYHISQAMTLDTFKQQISNPESMP